MPRFGPSVVLLTFLAALLSANAFPAHPTDLSIPDDKESVRVLRSAEEEEKKEEPEALEEKVKDELKAGEETEKKEGAEGEEASTTPSDGTDEEARAVRSVELHRAKREPTFKKGKKGGGCCCCGKKKK